LSNVYLQAYSSKTYEVLHPGFATFSHFMGLRAHRM
jgi:hypothetical protein